MEKLSTVQCLGWVLEWCCVGQDEVLREEMLLCPLTKPPKALKWLIWLQSALPVGYIQESLFVTKGISGLLEFLVLISWTKMEISLLPSYSSHLQATQPPLTCTYELQPGNQIFFLSPLRLTFKVHFYLCISKGRLSQGQLKDLIIWVESLEVQCTRSVLLEYEPLENALRAFRNTKIAADFCL